MSKSRKGFLALANATPAAGETITVQGNEITLRPVTVLEVVRLVKRFPSVKQILLGGAASETSVIEALIEEGPDALAAVIAVAGDNGGDPEAEGYIAALPDEDLIAILDKVIKLTMPAGVADFFGRFAALAAALGLQDTAKAA